MSREYQPLPFSYNIELSDPFPCPYLPSRQERDLVVSLTQNPPSPNATHSLYDNLCQLGFRRNGQHAYKPMCETCQECVPVRVLVHEFNWTKSLRRIMKKNQDITFSLLEPVAKMEHFEIFKNYLIERHHHQMEQITFAGYRQWIENSPVATKIMEFSRGVEIIGCMIVDIVNDGLSAVYSFYTCQFPSKSLGIFMILSAIKHTQSIGKPHLYLGYFIKNSPHMDYKLSFSPHQTYNNKNGWQPLEKPFLDRPMLKNTCE